MKHKRDCYVVVGPLCCKQLWWCCLLILSHCHMMVEKHNSLLWSGKIKSSVARTVHEHMSGIWRFRWFESESLWAVIVKLLSLAYCTRGFSSNGNSSRHTKWNKATRAVSTWEVLVQVNGLTLYLTHCIIAEMWNLNLVLCPDKLHTCVCVWTIPNFTTNYGFSNQCGWGTAYPVGVPNFVLLQFHQAWAFCLCWV